jgi:DNA-binding beta-propeller fold protein YncE
MKRALLILIAGGWLFAQNVPEIPFDAANLLKFPEHIYMGEGAGVATNSKGNIFVYTRTGAANAVLGGSRVFTHGGSRLFEFAPNGNYIREIGVGVYGFLLAHSVRVDAQDNVWVVDEGSSMVIKFSPDGRIAMTMGRKPESIAVGREGGGEGGGGGRGGPPGAGVRGDNFNRPTDVAFDPAGNIFVADGHGNSRVAKFDKNGRFIKSWGSKGSEPGQFSTLHTIAVDAQGIVYVGDRENKRIQVFDNDGNVKTQYTNAGAPYAMCISQGSHQYLYTSNSNPPTTMDNGEIYKMELDGRILGKFGKAGKLMKEFGTVLGMDCRNPNDVFVAEAVNWRVQKLTLHP